MEKEIRAAYADGELDGLHSVVVRRHGDLLAEVHFEGRDQAWGRDLGVRMHGPDVLHDLRSITKSITGLLYGIALADGIVPDVDTPVVEQFPEYPDLVADPARRQITIDHVLSMRMGIEWNEDLPYTDARNSEIAMELAPDRYRFVLERPLVHRPGTVWTYNGGATALIARIVARGAGKKIDTYADEKLFGPLGIESWEWVRGADGEPAAASGLRLTIHDLVKIGEMVRAGGRHDGREIVPETWLKASFTPRTDVPGGLRYGYFWWLSGQSDPPFSVAGFGNGGQRLSVGLANGMTLAVFAGNYNRPDAWKVPVRILVNIALPGIGFDLPRFED